MVTALAISAQEGDRTAMNELIRSMEQFAWSIVHKYNVSADLKKDMHQEALCAILEAIPKYDRTKAAFSTYAGHCMKSAMKDFIMRQWAVTIPYHAKKKSARIDEFIEKYRAERGSREIDERVYQYIQDVILGTRTTHEQIDRLIELNGARNSISLESLTQNDGSFSFEDTVEDDSLPELELLRKERKNKVKSWLSHLTGKQRQAVEMVHLDKREMSLDEIAQKIRKGRKVSRQAIKDREKNALTKMKQKAGKEKFSLDEYIA